MKIIGILFGVMVILNAVQSFAVIGVLKVLVFTLAGISIIMSALLED